MTTKLELNPEAEAGWLAQAKARGLSVDESSGGPSKTEASAAGIPPGWLRKNACMPLKS